MSVVSSQKCAMACSCVLGCAALVCLALDQSCSDVSLTKQYLQISGLLDTT